MWRGLKSDSTGIWFKVSVHPISAAELDFLAAGRCCPPFGTCLRERVFPEGLFSVGAEQAAS